MAKKRKPNYSLPADDHLVVKPIRRTKIEMDEAIVARLLSHEWSLFTSKDQKAAIKTAHYFGGDFADEVSSADDEDEACGDAKDYRRSVIRWAFSGAKVINDVEKELWRGCDNDPRVLAFGMGFEDRMSELRGTG